MGKRNKIILIAGGICALAVLSVAVAQTLPPVDSNIVTVTTQKSITPTQPCGYTPSCVAVSTSSISVVWKDECPGGINPPASFDLRASNVYSGILSGGSSISAGTGPGSYLQSGLTSGTQWWYKLNTTLSDGTSITSNIFSCTTLSLSNDTPTNLSVFSISPTELDLNWKDNVSSTRPYHFAIQRIKVTPEAVGSLSIQSSAPNAVTLYWSDFSSSTPYYTSIERATSTNFSAPGAITVMNVNYYDPVANGGISYKNYSYVDKTVQDATTYYYRLHACSQIPVNNLYNPVGSTVMKPPIACSDYLPIPPTVLSTSTSPFAPTGFSATVNSSNPTSAIDLQWTPQSVNATGYQVWRGTTNNVNSAQMVKDLPGTNISSYTDSGLNSGTAYYYWVRAYKNFGTFKLFSSWLGSTNATTNFTITISVSSLGSAGGTVSNNFDSEICSSGTCSWTAPGGTGVTLTANPNTGSYVTWSGCVSVSGNTCNAGSGDATISATFNVQTFTVTVNEGGTGTGIVTSTPTGIDCGGQPSVCTYSFPVGTSVTLTATPNSGSSFTSWAGGCTGTTSCVLNTDATVTANFGTVSSGGGIAVTVSPAGTGMVTSNPSGISCPNSCIATSYANGQWVTLTAIVLPPSFRFNYWTVNGTTGNCVNYNAQPTSTCKVGITAGTTVKVTANFISSLAEVPQSFASVNDATEGMLGALSGSLIRTNDTVSIVAEKIVGIWNGFLRATAHAWRSVGNDIARLGTAFVMSQTPIAEGGSTPTINFDGYFGLTPTISTSPAQQPSYDDNKTVSPNSVYLYRVRVIYDDGGTPYRSDWSSMVAGRTLKDKIYNSGNVGICTNNSICTLMTQNYSSEIDPVSNQNAKSENQCTTNADCRIVGRSSQVFQEH